ncbi:hypothetical protein [Flagellimonas sp. CMM7]|uniref:hypothetical protein n=1 Tax=Flagellimonas sp. CMM7 TaxID=2654676 RepID=UPI0013D7A20A|nr:hypothetical protein [Flagellimonas sp. CMM7]UII80029.1 hypothetical protein LV704_00560 [Flagellimonas sp. CMM7]
MEKPKTKNCKTCRQDKSVEDFHNQKASKDGRQNNCKKCANQLRRDWAKNNREKENNRMREYYKNNPEKLSEKNKKYFEKNPNYHKDYYHRVRKNKNSH